jgi:hypothetical protein
MTNCFDRQLENADIASHIELTEDRLKILFHFTWISQLNTNEKIEIRRIAIEGDPDSRYPFDLYIGYSKM